MQYTKLNKSFKDFINKSISKLSLITALFVSQSPASSLAQTSNSGKSSAKTEKYAISSNALAKSNDAVSPNLSYFSSKDAYTIDDILSESNLLSNSKEAEYNQFIEQRLDDITSMFPELFYQNSINAIKSFKKSPQKKVKSIYRYNKITGSKASLRTYCLLGLMGQVYESLDYLAKQTLLDKHTAQNLLDDYYPKSKAACISFFKDKSIQDYQKKLPFNIKKIKDYIKANDIKAGFCFVPRNYRGEYHAVGFIINEKNDVKFFAFNREHEDLSLAYYQKFGKSVQIFDANRFTSDIFKEYYRNYTHDMSKKDQMDALYYYPNDLKEDLLEKINQEGSFPQEDSKTDDFSFINKSFTKYPCGENNIAYFEPENWFKVAKSNSASNKKFTRSNTNYNA